MDLLGDLFRDSIHHGRHEPFECVHCNVSLRFLLQGPLWTRACPRTLAGILNRGRRRRTHGWCVFSGRPRSCRIADYHRYRSFSTDGANLISPGICFVVVLMTWGERTGLSDSWRSTRRRPRLFVLRPAKRPTPGCGPGNASPTVKSIRCSKRCECYRK